MPSQKKCATPGCFEIAYDNFYCDKCLDGRSPNKRGWVTNFEWIRAKLLRDDDYKTTFNRMLLNSDQLNSILDSYVYLFPEEAILQKKPPALKTKKTKKIFLSYASDDYLDIIPVYRQLKDWGHEPWLDKEKLLPGQTWEIEIEKAVERSDFFIAFLSKKSISKVGYVQKEMSIGLKYLTYRPIGTIFLIPVRLDDCAVPHTIKNIQWIDITSKDFLDKLFNAIEFEPT